VRIGFALKQHYIPSTASAAIVLTITFYFKGRIVELSAFSEVTRSGIHVEVVITEAADV